MELKASLICINPLDRGETVLELLKTAVENVTVVRAPGHAHQDT